MSASRQLTDADRVWNRACFREGTNFREGDLALGALLLVHGYVQNGGVGHAFELTPEEVASGIKGFEFFGFKGIADVIKPHSGEEEAEYDQRCEELTGGGGLIMERFQKMFQASPERFAPFDEAAAG
jgi:hypothetical protein